MFSSLKMVFMLMLYVLIANVCMVDISTCNRIELNSKQLKDYWYMDYESLSEDRLSTRRFDIKINKSISFNKEIEKTKTWLTNCWHNIWKMDFWKRQFHLNIIYAVLTLILLFIIVICIICCIIFCHTGYGCCCFRWMSPCCKIICYPKEAEENLKQLTLKLVPGAVYSEDGNVVTVYKPSPTEISVFNEVMTKIREL